ncbi:MAG: DUF1499 domain-containing protein [Alphaproteobacteria bacterium]
MDLRKFQRSSTPNDAFACPAGVCRAKPDFDSPVFALGVAQLLNRAEAILGAEPRTELVAKDNNLNQLVFVQRSSVLGFPDTVRVQAAKTDRGVVVIMHSQSNYGYWDLGANKKRVRDWLEKLSSGANSD